MSDEITPERMRKRADERLQNAPNCHRFPPDVVEMLEAGATALERCAELEEECRQRAHFEHNLMKRIAEYEQHR